MAVGTESDTLSSNRTKNKFLSISTTSSPLVNENPFMTFIMSSSWVSEKSVPRPRASFLLKVSANM